MTINELDIIDNNLYNLSANLSAQIYIKGKPLTLQECKDLHFQIVEILKKVRKLNNG